MRRPRAIVARYAGAGSPGCHRRRVGGAERQHRPAVELAGQVQRLVAAAARAQRRAREHLGQVVVGAGLAPHLLLAPRRRTSARQQVRRAEHPAVPVRRRGTRSRRPTSASATRTPADPASRPAGSSTRGRTDRGVPGSRCRVRWSRDRAAAEQVAGGPVGVEVRAVRRRTRRGRRAASEQRVLLELEQRLLALEPAGVAGERAVGADHPVARDHDRDRVAAVGQPDRARGGVGLAEPVRDLAVRRGLAVADPAAAASQTRCWKSVPRGASGRSNSLRSRAKYAVSWRPPRPAPGRSSSRSPRGRPSAVAERA